MPLYAEDLLVIQKHSHHCEHFYNSDNNNKYLNTRLINSGELQNHYLGPSGCSSNLDKSYFEPLKRINALKYFIGDELRIASNIKYCVLDMRQGKKKLPPGWIDFMDKSKVSLIA